jgi:hypothetical protein
MSGEINIIDGFIPDDSNLQDDGEYNIKFDKFTLHTSRCKNMDKLCSYFNYIENYPEFYLGVAKNIAICKHPDSGKEEWFNGERCLSINNPKKGSIVKIHVTVNNAIYKKDLIFMGWLNARVHEWSMKKGTILQL